MLVNVVEWGQHRLASETALETRAFGDTGSYEQVSDGVVDLLGPLAFLRIQLEVLVKGGEPRGSDSSGAPIHAAVLRRPLDDVAI